MKYPLHKVHIYAVGPPEQPRPPATLGINFEALPQAVVLPVEGTLVAYKLLEIGASFCPVVSLPSPPHSASFTRDRNIHSTRTKSNAGRLLATAYELILYFVIYIPPLLVSYRDQPPNLCGSWQDTQPPQASWLFCSAETSVWHFSLLNDCTGDVY
jgi:hypothetical protein